MTGASTAVAVGRGRLLAAVVLVPLFDAALGYLSYPDAWRLGNPGISRDPSPEQTAAAFAVLAGGLGLFVMIAAGLPAAFTLIRGGRSRLAHFVAAGAVLGNLPFAVYLCHVAAVTLVRLAMGTLGRHLSPPGALLAGGLRVVVIGSSFGAASGALFWLIAVRRLHRERRR